MSTTDLKKPVRRRTELTIRDGSKRRRLIVAMEPGDVITIRPEGTRREEVVSIDAVYALAVRHRVVAEQAEKRARKKKLG